MTDPGELKFILEDSTELPTKRQQVSRACELCRKKKRRCIHEIETAPRNRRKIHHGDTKASTAASQLLRSSSREDNPTDNGNTQTSSKESYVHPSDASPRFIGDLNPEGILIEAAMTSMSEDFNYQGTTDIGVWYKPNAAGNKPQPSGRNDLEQGPADEQVDPSAKPSTSINTLARAAPSHVKSIVDIYDDDYIEARASYLAPPPESWTALKNIYLTKIHPILPIFESLRISKISLVSQPLVYPSKSGKLLDHLIVASICLSAAVDPAAAPFLRFSGHKSPDPITYSNYGSSLVEFIRTASRKCEKKLDACVLDYIRVLALTSFYWQPNSADRHEPTIIFAEVVSLVHAYGLHVTGLNDLKTTGYGYTMDKTDSEKLFACIVAMDRINAALHGRAIMLADRDLSPDLHSRYKAPSTFEPGLRLLMLLVLELDTVIDLYRPRPTVANLTIPVFEALVLHAGAENESQFVLATLEVLYHAVSVLSVRMDHTCFIRPPETSDTIIRDHTGELKYLPDPNLNTRRSLSSDRILWIIHNHTVSPLPFVPYALSLSLSVAYRKWRFSRIPMFRARGRTSFEDVLRTMINLGMAFMSLKRIQILAQMVITEMGKAEDKRKERQRGLNLTTPKLSVLKSHSNARAAPLTYAANQSRTTSQNNSIPESDQAERDDQGSVTMSMARLQPTVQESIHCATKPVGTTQSICTEPNVYSEGSQSGHQNTIIGEFSHSLNPSTRQLTNTQKGGEGSLLSLESENGWNQRAADGQNQPSHIATPGQLLEHTPLRLHTPGPSPEDLFTVDLFPYFDSEFPQSQIDLAFSSHLDLSSGQPWLNDWWENRFVPMEGRQS